MTISLKSGGLSPAEGSIPDPLPALISELIRYPLCEIDDEVRTVFARGGKARCAFCREAPVEEVDHIIPVARGGPDRLENYVGTCRPCNMRKSGNLLPLGVLGILLAEAAANAPGRRARMGALRAARDRSYPRRRTERPPSTRQLPHHIRLSLPQDELMDLIRFDEIFRGAIPFRALPDRLIPAVERLLSGPLADGPYADRLEVRERDGMIVYTREVASLWIALLNLRGELPQVITGPDWPAQRICARANRNRGGKIYQAHVSFGLRDAERLLPILRKADNSGELVCDGEEAAHLHAIMTSRAGLHGALIAPGWGGANLFPEGSAGPSGVRIRFSIHAARVLEILIRERSASVLMRETGSVLRDLNIDRTVPVRPGLLFRADQDWSAETEKRERKTCQHS